MTVRITYFVHGTTTDNERGLATGWLPGALSPPGIRQAKELGRIVSGKPFDALFCSDLKRAVDTAGIAFGNRYTITKDKRLRECDYGDFTGKPTEALRKELHVNKPFPNGESYRDAEKRIAAFLGFLKKKHDRRRIALVAHQAPQLSLDVLLRGKTWKKAIEEDWRNRVAWQPGWEYVLD